MTASSALLVAMASGSARGLGSRRYWQDIVQHNPGGTPSPSNLLLVMLSVLVIAGHMRGYRPSAVTVLVAVFGFAVPPIGAFWMMYMAIRHENSPFPLILLACVPYASVWYYFDRVRTNKPAQWRTPGRTGAA